MPALILALACQPSSTSVDISLGGGNDATGSAVEPADEAGLWLPIAFSVHEIWLAPAGGTGKVYSPSGEEIGPRIHFKFFDEEYPVSRSGHGCDWFGGFEEVQYETGNALPWSFTAKITKQSSNCPPSSVDFDVLDGSYLLLEISELLDSQRTNLQRLFESQDMDWEEAGAPYAIGGLAGVFEWDQGPRKELLWLTSYQVDDAGRLFGDEAALVPQAFTGAPPSGALRGLGMRSEPISDLPGQ